MRRIKTRGDASADVDDGPGDEVVADAKLAGRLHPGIPRMDEMALAQRDVRTSREIHRVIAISIVALSMAEEIHGRVCRLRAIMLFNQYMLTYLQRMHSYLAAFLRHHGRKAREARAAVISGIGSTGWRTLLVEADDVRHDVDVEELLRKHVYITVDGVLDRLRYEALVDEVIGHVGQVVDKVVSRRFVLDERRSAFARRVILRLDEEYRRRTRSRTRCLEDGRSAGQIRRHARLAVDD